MNIFEENYRLYMDYNNTLIIYFYFYAELCCLSLFADIFTYIGIWKTKDGSDSILNTFDGAFTMFYDTWMFTKNFILKQFLSFQKNCSSRCRATQKIVCTFSYTCIHLCTDTYTYIHTYGYSVFSSSCRCVY